MHSFYLHLKKWIIQFIEDPEYKIAQILLRFIKNDWLPDRMYVKYQFHYVFGYPLNLKNPRTFNEKLQWIKLYDHNPLYTLLVDKVRVKDWVAERIGAEHIIPTLAIYHSVDEIDIDKLPNQFVLKCNHDSGSIVICRDKSTFNLDEAKKKLEIGLKHNFYLKHREWAYKNVKPLIFAECFMSQELLEIELTDYKFYCFDGEPVFLYVSSGLENHSTARISFLTLEWQFAPFKRNDFENYDVLPRKPKQFETLLTYARLLASGLRFVRVDLYEVAGNIYFSELTFYPCAGLMPFDPKEYDEQLGNMITI